MRFYLNYYYYYNRHNTNVNVNVPALVILSDIDYSILYDNVSLALCVGCYQIISQSALDQATGFDRGHADMNS